MSRRVRPRWPSSVRFSSAVNAQYASSTVTCAMVTGSGPSLSTDSRMPSGVSTARSTISRSTGGAPSGWTSPSGPVRISTNSSTASSASGMTASIQTRLADGRSIVVSGITARPRSFEKPHPSELCELTLMGVEHELAGIAEAGLDDRALTLAEHQRVGRFDYAVRLVPVRYASKNIPCRWMLLIRSNSVTLTTYIRTSFPTSTRIGSCMKWWATVLTA